MSRWLRIGFGLCLIVLAVGLYLMPQFTYTNEAQGESLVFVPLGLLMGIAAIGLIVAATGLFDVDGADAREKAAFDAIPYAEKPAADDAAPAGRPKETPE